jgi:putative transposase
VLSTRGPTASSRVSSHPPVEPLDQHRWETRQQLALAIFEWIECWYNPRPRHCYCSMLSPADPEAAHRGGGLATAA